MIDTATKAPCTKDGCQLSADMGKGPYANSVNLYTEFGWRGVLPLPHMKKMTPPSGFTGMVNTGIYPTDHQIHVWAHNSNSNVALRLPENVIGIDVDHYEKKGVEKDGADQLAELEAQLGALPATWRSTSRGYANPSGIRFYRVPSGLLWPSKTGFIDFVQHNYRYAVVWPSEVVNESTGEVRQYRWYGPVGQESEGVPKVEELPELPQAWVDHLQNLPKVKENDDL